jgi:photosystem II stability/assembly factor-like uncharacterized protein
MEAPPLLTDPARVRKEHQTGVKPSHHWPLLLAVLLAVCAATIWQIQLNQQPNVPLAGRPLSSSQTHLHTLAMSPQSGVIYLGTHFGLFASTDAGRTWPQRQGDLSLTMILSIAVSPSNPRMLAVLAMPDGNPSGRGGVYVSADAGEHWQYSVPAPGYPYSIQGAPGLQGHFYAFFSQDGWFETRDLGRHWQPITHGTLAGIQTPSLLLDPARPDHLLMGGDQGLFESENDGHSWQQVMQVQGAVLSLTAARAGAGHAQTILCVTDQGLYRQQGQGPFFPLRTLPAASLPIRVLFSADGSALYALVGADLWASQDRGESWVHRWHFARGDLVSLVVSPYNSQQLLAGFFWPGLVLVSTNAGKSWRTLTD